VKVLRNRRAFVSSFWISLGSWACTTIKTVENSIQPITTRIFFNLNEEEMENAIVNCDLSEATY
jgi:hypothetical protein